MTRGRAAATDPFDISAVSRSDELFDALAARRLADLGAGCAESDDPAAGLLAALVADVDKGAPPLPAPTRVACASSRRRGVRAVVTFGVAAVVLTSAGAAAAGGNGTRAADTPHGLGGLRAAERSNENIRHQKPADGLFFAVRRSPRQEHHSAPGTDVTHPSGDKSTRRGAHKTDKADKPSKATWGEAHPPAETSDPPPDQPDPHASTGVRRPLLLSGTLQPDTP